MKKILAMVAFAAILFTGCKGDDSSEGNIPKPVSATVSGSLTGALQEAMTVTFTWTDFEGKNGTMTLNKENPNFSKTFLASKIGDKMEVRYSAVRNDGDLSSLKGPWSCYMGTTVYLDGSEFDHYSFSESEQHDLYLSNPSKDPVGNDYLGLMLSVINVSKKYVITVSKEELKCEAVDID